MICHKTFLNTTRKRYQYRTESNGLNLLILAWETMLNSIATDAIPRTLWKVCICWSKKNDTQTKLHYNQELGQPFLRLLYHTSFPFIDSLSFSIDMNKLIL